MAQPERQLDRHAQNLLEMSEEKRALRLLAEFDHVELDDQQPKATSLAEQLAFCVRHTAKTAPAAMDSAMQALAVGLPPPAAWFRSADLRERPDRPEFLVSGVPLPATSHLPYLYIQTGNDAHTTLSCKLGVGSPGVALAMIGCVHYRAGLPARLRLLGRDRRTRVDVGIGAEWVVSPGATVRLTAGRPRVLIVIAGADRYDVYCDGLPVASGAIEGDSDWSEASIVVSGHLAPAGDLMLYRAAAWALDRNALETIRQQLSSPGSALPRALIADGNFAALARFCVNNPGPALEPAAAASSSIAAGIAALVDARKSHLAQVVADRLPEPLRTECRASITELAGNPMVAVSDLDVVLERNPSMERQLYRRLVGRKRETFAAVSGVNFDIHRGDVVGIIGHNGAGKTTLLRALCGLIGISRGEIRISDQFMLLRPGLGMRDELTGRENIISMGFYKGLHMRQIEGHTDDIVNFAELQDHIDKPVKYYSDGMRARLSFAISTSYATEILFLDELLGAGDISFQEKAQSRLKRFIGDAGTVVVVTHSINFVLRSCNKALLMHRGQQVCFGDPQDAVGQYLFLLEGRVDDSANGGSERVAMPDAPSSSRTAR